MPHLFLLQQLVFLLPQTYSDHVYHRYGILLVILWLQLLRRESEAAMATPATSYDVKATVTSCPRSLQLFQIKDSYLLPKLLFCFCHLLPLPPSSHHIRYCCCSYYSCYHSYYCWHIASIATTELSDDFCHCQQYHTRTWCTATCHHVTHILSIMSSLTAVAPAVWSVSIILYPISYYQYQSLDLRFCILYHHTPYHPSSLMSPHLTMYSFSWEWGWAAEQESLPCWWWLMRICAGEIPLQALRMQSEHSFLLLLQLSWLQEHPYPASTLS